MSLHKKAALKQSLKKQGYGRMLSVNTNYGAMTALQNLSLASSEKQQIQSRINTGLKVGSVTDNGAIWAIAKGITSDVVDTSVNISQLDQTKSVLDVTLSALDSISDLMIEMKEKALALTDESMTYEQMLAFSEDYNALFDQAQTISRNASFNDLNLLDGSTLTLTPTSLSAIDGFDLADMLENGVTRTGDFDGVVNSNHSATVTGNFSGVVNGSFTGTTYGDMSGVVNGDYNGDIYGDFTGSVNGNINGTIYGSNNGSVNGSVTGSVHNGSVDPPQEVTIEVADEVPASYLGRTYGGIEGYEEDPFSFDPKSDLTYHFTGMVAAIENTISGLGNYASKLGTMSKAVDTQSQFLQVKQDTLIANRGNLVDADMAKESARLNAIQTKEQLAVQALGIANQAPNILVRLFG